MSAPRRGGKTATPKGGVPGRFRRILLALDAAADDPAGLDALASLAARLQAEVHGLTVEDEEELDLADHPGVRFVSRVSTTVFRMERGVVERSQRYRAEVSRRTLAGVMAAHRVKASFEVRRGPVADEVIAKAEDADLIVLGWGSGGFAVRAPGRPGRIACAVAERSQRPVLLLHPGSPAGGPMLVAYDGTPAGEKALEAAVEIARPRDGHAGSPVTIALLTARLSDAEAWRADVAARLAAEGMASRFMHFPAATASELIAAARQSGAALLVLGVEGPNCCGGEVRAVLDRAGCSVLLVR